MSNMETNMTDLTPNTTLTAIDMSFEAPTKDQQIADMSKKLIASINEDNLADKIRKILTAILSDVLVDYDAEAAMAEDKTAGQRYFDFDKLNDQMYEGWQGLRLATNSMNSILLQDINNPDYSNKDLQAMLAPAKTYLDANIMSKSAEGLDVVVSEYLTAMIEYSSKVCSGGVDEAKWFAIEWLDRVSI